MRKGEASERDDAQRRDTTATLNSIRRGLDEMNAGNTIDAGTAHEKLTHRNSLLEGIVRGEQAILDGRTITQEEAKDRMGRWLSGA